MSVLPLQLQLIGTSSWSVNIRQRIANLASSVLSVLVTGPEGSGKKLIARALHAAGARSQAPLVPVDCRTLTGLVAESQLFGHVPGGNAFASGAALGCLRAADGGVLLLSGVDQLDLATQVRLRDALVARRVTPLGGTQSHAINVQVIATSECDLAFEVAAGTFDYDLYELLSAVCLETLSLEERREDLVELAQHFLTLSATGEPKTLAASAVAWMQCYPWPGNVAQLKDLIDRIQALPQSCIDFAALKSLGPSTFSSQAAEGFVTRKRFGGFAALRSAQRPPCRAIAASARRCNRRSA